MDSFNCPAPSKTRPVRSIVFVLILLAGVGYGLFVITRASVRIIASLDSDIAVAIIAAGATVVVSVFSLVLGRMHESSAQIRKEHREKKTPVYEDLIHFMHRVIMGAKTGDAPTEKELLEFMATFTQRIMVWGSDDVLAAWIKWRRRATDEAATKEHPFGLMLLYEELILTIRRDLGHRNKGLVRGDVLALFINDIDQQLQERRT